MFIHKSHSFNPAFTRSFASKMMGGSTSNKKDSAGRRLGIKRWGKAEVLENEIIARQRGMKWVAGDHVRVGKDHTLHADAEVRFHANSNRECWRGLEICLEPEGSELMCI